MSTNNIGFYEDLTKIIFELSSNTHLISSAETAPLGSANSADSDLGLHFFLSIVIITYSSLLNIQYFCRAR